MMPPIHTFTEKGNYKRVEALLTADPHLVHAQLSSANPDQPLHLAAWQNHPKLVKLLIERGADLNARGSWGFTPLHYAARHGAVESAKLLLDAGANPNLLDGTVNTPLLLAVRGAVAEPLAVAKALLEAGAQADLNSLVGLGEVEQVIERVRNDGLASAVFPQDLVYDACLMINGKVLGAGGYDPSPAIQEQVVAHYGPIITCLVQAGADPNAIPTTQQPALYLAGAKKILPLVRFLVKNGADVNLRLQIGSTTQDAFYYLRGSSAQPVRELLLELGFLPTSGTVMA